MEPQIQDPAYRERLATIFSAAPFIVALGIQPLDVGPGWCETWLPVRPEQQQQDGFVHAGVVATLADHTAGGAAGTLMAAGDIVLTVEFKINLLRPAVGEQLRCRAEVLKPGRRFSVVEAVVHAWRSERATLVAKLTATMAYIPQADVRRTGVG